jgi:hypothetical protein
MTQQDSLNVEGADFESARSRKNNIDIDLGDCLFARAALLPVLPSARAAYCPCCLLPVLPTARAAYCLCCRTARAAILPVLLYCRAATTLTLSIMTLSIKGLYVTLGVTMYCHYAECRI